MSFGSWIDDRITNVVKILGVEKRLDKLQADAKQEIDDFRAQAMQELAVTRDKAFAELEETRDKALAMMRDTLPQMAGEVSKAAVMEVFKETQTDETINRVAGAFNDILNAIPFGLGGPRQ